MTGVIRTLGGDLPAVESGPILTHEHLVIDSPLVAAEMPHIHLHSIEEGVAEVQRCVAAGVRTMVDAMPAGSGRDPEKLTRISIMTGMKVVAATGLHTERYYRDVPWAGTETAEELARRFIADIEDGIDLHDYRGDQVERGEVRAGVVKVATSDERLSARDLRLFEAAAMTSLRTRAPILTHTEGGRGGLAQIEDLITRGVNPSRVALSHTDKVSDPAYHLEMLSSGVFLCMDQGLREPKVTADLVNHLSSEGHSSQLLLGTDGARRTLWSTLGGSPGLAHLYKGFADMLDVSRTQIFEDNPRRWLMISQPAAD